MSAALSRAAPRRTVAPSSDSVQASLQQHLARSHELRAGLHLHADDALDTVDFTANGEMGAGLRIVVLLDGSVDVSYGTRRVALTSRGEDGASTPRAMLVSVAEPDVFERRARRGNRARRVSIGVGADWLERMGGPPASAIDGIDLFRRSHLAIHHWQPSSRVVALAEQITRAPALNPMLQHLYLETRALELVGEALASLEQHRPGPAPAPLPAPSPTPASLRLHPHEHRRMRTLHAFLQRDEAMDLSLDELAREAGINPTTLQRHFRAVYGTTIFDFLRETRLQRARHALEHDGLSVAQAALLAGYNSAANFATAFRRRFGMPPKFARARI